MNKNIAIIMCLALILTGLPITVVAEGSPPPVITVNPVSPDNEGRIVVRNAISVEGQTNQYTVLQSGNEVDIEIERYNGYEIDTVTIGTVNYSNDSDFTGAVTGSAITLIRNFTRERIDIAYRLTEDITVSATFRESSDPQGSGDPPGPGDPHGPGDPPRLVDPYTVTIAENQYVTVTTGSAVTLNNSSFTSNQEEVTYYFELAEGRAITEVRYEFENGFEMLAMTSYDTATNKIYTTIRESSNYTLKVITAPISLDIKYFAILTSEAGDDSTMKAAIQREIGMQGVIVSETAITITDDTAPFTLPEGVGYIKVEITDLGVKHFYTVNDYNDLLIILDRDTTDSLVLIDNLTESTTDIEIPAIASGKLYAFGPYAVFAMRMSEEFMTDSDGGYLINKRFNRMQWHLVNQGQGNNSLNVFGLNVIAENAPCIKAVASKEGITQEAFAWSINSYPNISDITATKISYQFDIYYGNDTITLSSLGGIGDVKAISVVGDSNSPGYTFADSGSNVVIEFLSDFYDTITIPLSITLQNDSTIAGELMINRLGVDILHHSIGSGDPAESIRHAWHGTQFGCWVDISGTNQYHVTASYYIPDFGDTKPYGLYVTRRFSDGRYETEIITEAMNTCSVDRNFSYDPASNVFKYKEEGNSNVNVVDYLVYSGASEAVAPIEISVLVLKDNPVGASFGGVDFGSGTGVTWER